MTKTLTLRDVPAPIVRGLRERAKRNHRSMQKEILFILQGAVLDRGSLAEQLARIRSETECGMSLDEIHAAIDEDRP